MMVQGCLQGRCNATLVSGCCASRGFPTPWEVMVLSENEREQRVHSETLHDVATDVKPESHSVAKWGQVPAHYEVSCWSPTIEILVESPKSQLTNTVSIRSTNGPKIYRNRKRCGMSVCSKIKDHDAILFCMQSIQDSHSARTSKNTMSGEC
jgi:hypothetical protein